MADSVSNPYVYLPGLALSGYRSFGPNIQFMGPFSQVNVFAGPNNSGKSNVLRFIHKHLVDHRPRQNESVRQSIEVAIDKHYLGNLPLLIGTPIANDEDSILKLYPDGSPLQRNVASWILNSKAAMHGTSLAWTFSCWELPDNNQMEWARRAPFAGHLIEIQKAESAILPAENSIDWKSGHRTESFSNIFAVANKCFNDTKIMISEIPKVQYIPAFRQIRPQGHGRGITLEDYDGDGSNLVELYATIEQADHTEYHRAEPMINSIRQFLVDVTGEESIRLKVPFHRNFFEVVRQGRPERLDCLGSGIHQLILLAIIVTLKENLIICLEEPEVFLHPILQRKLIEYLKTTSNQYFISTHSAQFLDVPNVAVFHLEMTNDGTKVTKAETSSARFAVCRDLGYRASDIVQANCVLWVEGPSELIYLRKWIGETDATLREGIEYSVMFYGGSLRSWLTGDDPEEADELISLVAINRHCAFIMDSDKSEESTLLNANKLRVKASVEGNNGLAWITQGREIENYIPFDLRKRSVKAIAPTMESKMKKAWPYGYALPEEKGKGSKVDKIKFAKAVCNQPVEWGDTDLRTKIGELVNYIRKANRLEAISFPEA